MDLGEMIMPAIAITGGISIAVAMYPIALGVEGLPGLSTLPCYFSQKIHTQEELDTIVKEEAEKLGIQEPIKAVLHQKLTGPFPSRNGDGTYQVDLGGIFATRSAVKHELYHIYKGHVDNRPKNAVLRELYFAFIQQSQAVAYQYGIKL